MLRNKLKFGVSQHYVPYFDSCRLNQPSEKLFQKMILRLINVIGGETGENARS